MTDFGFEVTLVFTKGFSMSVLVCLLIGYVLFFYWKNILVICALIFVCLYLHGQSIIDEKKKLKSQSNEITRKNN